MRLLLPTIALGLLLAGCGTSRFTDTRRSATEQLLISDAMDRAVSRLDFRALAGKKVFFDSSRFKTAQDYEYLESSLRQHLAASGALLADDKGKADYILEGRVGAVGTDRHELLFGIPETRIPSIVPAVAGIPTNIPEVPLVKKTEQRAVLKVGLFAYNRETGRPVWQSGLVPVESEASDFWILGAGPFQKGSIYKGMNFAGDRLSIPLITPGEPRGEEYSPLTVGQQAFFADPDAKVEQSVGEKASPKPDPKQTVKKEPEPPQKSQTPQVVPASHQESKPPAPKQDASRAATPKAAMPAAKPDPAPPPSASGAEPSKPAARAPASDAPTAPWPDVLRRETPECWGLLGLFQPSARPRRPPVPGPVQGAPDRGGGVLSGGKPVHPPQPGPGEDRGPAGGLAVGKLPRLFAREAEAGVDRLCPGAGGIRQGDSKARPIASILATDCRA